MWPSAFTVSEENGETNDALFVSAERVCLDSDVQSDNNIFDISTEGIDSD